MNEEIIFKWDREKIESQLEDVFDKELKHIRNLQFWKLII